jgi:hypothetical protein
MPSNLLYLQLKFIMVKNYIIKIYKNLEFNYIIYEFINEIKSLIVMEL